MKKRFILLCLMTLPLMMAAAQDQIVPITSFENGEDWQWTGGNVQFTLVEEMPAGIQPIDGDWAMTVNYDNLGGTWKYSSMTFPTGSVDLTGMREIHVWVYFSEECEGDLSMRLDLADGNILGMAYASAKGEWQELVFPIDRKLANSEFIKTVGWVGGFICPETGTNHGEVYVDNIYAVRPADTVEVEEKLVYGFNEADPDTGFPVGWQTNEGQIAELGLGETTPKEGSNYMVFAANSSYAWNVQTSDAINAFDRWAEVQEILFDVFIPEAMSDGWIQSRIAVQSGITDNTDSEVWTETKELGYSGATSDWRELLFSFDITPHQANLMDPAGWIAVHISTNNGANDGGKFVFVDNFRVAVPVVSDVSNWSIF
ncbi:MAG: hypothetical protein GC154_18770 [bacterium]|nr:hypothetical protein [bacterium]